MTRRGAALRVTGWCALIALELLVLRAYLGRGALAHFWLHVLDGLGVGLAVAALARRGRPLAWALAGEAVSIAPDLLFVYARLPHEAWMDVFLGHVRVHGAPLPVLGALAVAVLGSWAAELRSRRLGLAALLVLALSLAVAAPAPTTLLDTGRPGAALRWWCR